MATDPYEEFRNVVPQIVADEAKLDSWINGGVNETVQTDGGPIPTWANIIAQLNAAIGGDMTTLPATSEGAEETRTLGNWMGMVEKTYNTLAQLLQDDKLKIGSIVQIIGRENLFDGGGNVYEFVASGSGVTDGGSYIDHTESGGQLRGVFPGGSINVKQFGARGNNIDDDTSSINFAVDYASTITNGNGATLFFPNGIYKTTSPIIWKPNVSFELEKSAIIRAGEVMESVLINNSGASNRISRVSFSGGVIDANFKALSCVRLKDFQQVSIHRFQFRNCDEKYVHLNDASQSSGNFELDIGNGYIQRMGGNPFTTQEPYGIYSDPSGVFGDSWFSSIVIIGCKYAIYGSIYNSDFHKVHPWSFPISDGVMHTAFYVQGSANTMSHCYADNANVFSYRFDGVGNSMIGCRVLRGSVSTPDEGIGVYMDAGSTLVASNCVFRGSSASSMLLRDFSGDLSGLEAHNNITINVINSIGDYESVSTRYSNVTSVSGAEGNIFSGTYTPVITSIDNATKINDHPWRFNRVGNVVTVSGIFQVSAGSTGESRFRATLPIPTAFTAIGACSGNFSSYSSSSPDHGVIYADEVNDEAEFKFSAEVTTGVFRMFTFTYTIS